MSEEMSERLPEDTPERMSKKVSEDMPERISEDMPERMSANMPEKMPNSCFNIFARNFVRLKCHGGITQSKEIGRPCGIKTGEGSPPKRVGKGQLHLSWIGLHTLASVLAEDLLRKGVPTHA